MLDVFVVCTSLFQTCRLDPTDLWTDSTFDQLWTLDDDDGGGDDDDDFLRSFIYIYNFISPT